MRLGAGYFCPVSPQLSIGRLDFDDIRAEVGQNCRCCGTRDEAGQFYPLSNQKRCFSSAIKSPCRKIESGCNSTLTPDCSVSGVASAPETSERASQEKQMFLLSCLRSPRKSQKGKLPGASPSARLRIQSFVYRLDGILHADGCVGNDLVEKSFNPSDQVSARNNFIHQADAIGFVRIDDFA